MKSLTQLIEREKIPCLFVSPHPDDAILSAGGLIAHLAKYTKVTVATVFTEAQPGRSTLSARRFLQLSGTHDQQLLFEKRRQEDTNACQAAGAEVVHLGFIDASWRRKEHPSRLARILGRILPEFLHLYPTHRLHIASNHIAAQDDRLVEDIAQHLSRIRGEKHMVVFCPLALDTHIDHMVVRRACTKAFGHQIVFWSDWPYRQYTEGESARFKQVGLRQFHWQRNVSVKRKAVTAYKTQLRSLFPKGAMTFAPEVFFHTLHEL